MLSLVIEIILLCVIGLPLFYLLGLSVLALLAREKKEFSAKRQRRFALVVPAHNEEQSIQKTVQNLLSLHYPQELYEVIVIADNCIDQTAKIARCLGATVYERTDPVRRSKGYALRWLFDRLLEANTGFDAFVVIDADSVAEENYLVVLNYHLDRGARAIQSSDIAAPQPSSWSSEITRLGLTLYNYVRPLGRTLFGGTAGIRGNGMCFTASTLKAIPWSTYSLNEDLEYGLILLLHGIKVVFAAEAKVLATMPAQAKHAQSQRARWEAGRFPVIKTYSGKLLWYALRNLSLCALDAWIDLLIPAFVNLFGAAALVFATHLLLLLIGWGVLSTYTLIWACALLAGLAHVGVGLAVAHADRDLVRAVSYIPRYAAWKMLLYLRIARQGTETGWVRTTRDEALPTRDQ